MTIHDTIRARYANRPAAATATFEEFQQAERGLFWQHLVRSSLSEAARLDELARFDDAMAQLRIEVMPRVVVDNTADLTPLATLMLPAIAGLRPAARAPLKTSSAKRDIVLLLLGAMLGIPIGLLLNLFL